MSPVLWLAGRYESPIPTGSQIWITLFWLASRSSPLSSPARRYESRCPDWLADTSPLSWLAESVLLQHPDDADEGEAGGVERACTERAPATRRLSHRGEVRPSRVQSCGFQVWINPPLIIESCNARFGFTPFVKIQSYGSLFSYSMYGYTS